MTHHIGAHEGEDAVTIIIGIDPHKATHTAVAVDETEQTLKAPSAGIYPHDCRPAERPSTGEPVDRTRSVNGDAKLDAPGNGTSVGLPPTLAGLGGVTAVPGVPLPTRDLTLTDG